MKSGNLNFLELSGPLQACNGTALPFYLCGRNSKMAWHCLHLKFMGAIHFKHINRIKWPHSAAALTKVTRPYYFQYAPMKMAYF
jgi:hypothetical protein